MNDDMPLGRTTPYPEKYSPELLFGIPRARQRGMLGIGADLPFSGVDIWNAWELGWLDPQGMPRSATAEIRVPAASPNLIESKSLKLYLDSFALTAFASSDDIVESIEQDLSNTAGADVAVRLGDAAPRDAAGFAVLPGRNLDERRIRCTATDVEPGLLVADPGDLASETLHSHLLRSLCPVTGQPDSGSVLIDYRGPRLDPDGLLRYIVSYRRHQDFHESCVERMFVDISERCRPERLSVYARYQRRGGIDINPFRSNHENDVPNLRLWRQ